VQGGDRAVHLVGRLDADTSLTGTGGDPATVRHTLAGRGHAEVHDGAIRGLNVADGVLTGTTGLAGLTTLVPLRVRERHPDIFATGDTRFQTLTADFRMANEKLHLDSAVATAKDYDVRSHGSVTFAQYVDVTGTLHASPGLTADIVGAIKEARFLTDEASMLAIPFRMAGQLPNVRPQVDTEFVGRALKKALVDEGLDRLLDGAKTGSKDSGKGSTRDLLRRGLGQLFGR